MPRHPPNALTTLNRSHCQCSSFSRPFLRTTDRPGYLLQPSQINNAIDVFDPVTLLELRRAAHLCQIFKTSFSRLNPGSRGQATIISNPSEAPKCQQRTTRATGFLPTSSPSPGSGRLGPHKDHQNWARTSRQPIGLLKYLEASRSIFSSQCMQNRHQASARCKPFFLQKTTTLWARSQARGLRPSLAGPSSSISGASRDSVRTQNGGA